MKPFATQTLIITTNGIRMHLETSGPADGPLVVMLHGFPELWYGFAEQMGPLSQSGFRVVAPDQRGYNLTDKPQGVAAYRLDTLAQDILGILDYFQRRKAVIIGHDWGAAVAWHLAIHYPERVEKLVILNVPHPAALARALREKRAEQGKRSWYIGFFQIPRLPEFLLSLGNYAPMRRMMRASARPDTFSKADLRRYTQAWSRPGALTAMINWYRASVRGMLANRKDSYFADAHARVSMPTLILWGEQDVALIPELAEWSLKWCNDGRLVRFPEATHWVQHDAAERVTNRILDFLEEPGAD